MKTIFLALCLGMVASPVFAAATSQVPPLFPDAPPPPQVAELLMPYCCTVTGRRMFAPDPNQVKPVVEGAACVAKTPDGPAQVGTVCY